MDRWLQKRHSHNIKLLQDIFWRRNWFWSRFGWSVPASSHGLSPALHRVPIESGFLKTFFSRNWFRSRWWLHSSGHQVTARPASVPGLNASTSKPNSARRFLLCKAKSGTFFFYINMSWWYSALLLWHVFFSLLWHKYTYPFFAFATLYIDADFALRHDLSRPIMDHIVTRDPKERQRETKRECLDADIVGKHSSERTLLSWKNQESCSALEADISVKLEQWAVVSI